MVETILFQIAILENGEREWIKIARNLCLKSSCSLVQLRSHKKALYLSVNVISTKALIGDTIYVSYWRRDRHFTWSSDPPRSSHLQGKGSTFISQSFWDPECWSSPENRPATSRSAVNRSTDWANPAAVKAVFKEVFNFFQVEISLVGNFNETCLAVILQDVTFHSRASLCNVMATDTIAQNSVLHQFANINTIKYINLSA